MLPSSSLHSRQVRQPPSPFLLFGIAQSGDRCTCVISYIYIVPRWWTASGFRHTLLGSSLFMYGDPFRLRWGTSFDVWECLGTFRRRSWEGLRTLFGFFSYVGSIRACPKNNAFLRRSKMADGKFEGFHHSLLISRGFFSQIAPLRLRPGVASAIRESLVSMRRHSQEEFPNNYSFCTSTSLH